MIDARITGDPIDPAAELAGFLEGAHAAGAVVSFIGIARPHRPDGAAVSGLFIDHHPTLTARSVASLAAAAHARFALTGVQAVHRYGLVRPGEPIVFVAAAAPHRRAAFLAADCLMDRLKTEAVFWKREETDHGVRWVEPSAADYADMQRWGHHGD